MILKIDQISYHSGTQLIWYYSIKKSWSDIKKYIWSNIIPEQSWNENITYKIVSPILKIDHIFHYLSSLVLNCKESIKKERKC